MGAAPAFLAGVPGPAIVAGAPRRSFLSTMSIAVSAVLRPSRFLRALVLLYAAANLGAGLALASGRLGDFPAPWLLAGCCLLAAMVLPGAPGCAETTRRIDISGLGQIRVTVQQNVSADSVPGVLVDLIPGSTIWSCAMVLRLRDEAGSVRALMLFPDSVAQGRFRTLAVALRAIAGRDNTFFGTNKIL
ncbi:MAG: hypothetical protein Q8R69_23880 [Telluria sp.]|nr:hypothetical protein [Telluria sp.]